MKIGKTILAFSLLALYVSFSSCQKEKEDAQIGSDYAAKIIGSWIGSNWTTTYLYFCDNGTFKMVQIEPAGGDYMIDEIGTWTIENNDILLQNNSGFSYSFTIDYFDVSESYSVVNLFEGNATYSSPFLLFEEEDPCQIIAASGGNGNDGGDGGDGTANCPATVNDIDGNLYHVVKIGNQCWLKENLKTTHFNDGTPILPGTFTSDTYEMDWIYSTTGYYLPVQSPVGSLSDYLYNFAALTDNRGICPEGFRLPTREDYEVLVEYLGGPIEASSALKATSQWYSINVFMHDNPLIYNNGTNSSGFSAYPTGRISTNFIDKTNHSAIFWTSTGYSEDSRVGFSMNAYVFEPFSLDVAVNTRNEVYINELAAIRCIAE